MTLRDLLKKKDKVVEQEVVVPEPQESEDVSPTFTFMRSVFRPHSAHMRTSANKLQDTHTQELISPPTFSSDASSDQASLKPRTSSHESRAKSLFKGRARSVSGASGTSTSSQSTHTSGGSRSPNSRRLSQRLGLRRSNSSTHVPSDLPEINSAGEDGAQVESQWEKRATLLARENEKEVSRPATPTGSGSRSAAELRSFASMSIGGSPRSGGEDKHVVSTKYVDDNIQEAIRLHEAGDLQTSTAMFGRLADPNGENNALSQVLYGLALRYVVHLAFLHAALITPMNPLYTRQSPQSTLHT